MEHPKDDACRVQKPSFKCCLLAKLCLLNGVHFSTEYRIFAQVHLPTLVDHTVRGQDWRAALGHINRKSVDFVLCDKSYVSPKLAVELDDKSHERSDRQERDHEVERILHEADVPLLRIENHGNFNPSELSQRIKETLSPKPASL